MEIRKAAPNGLAVSLALILATLSWLLSIALYAGEFLLVFHFLSWPGAAAFAFASISYRLPAKSE